LYGYGPCLARLGKYPEALERLLRTPDDLIKAKQPAGNAMRQVLTALIEVCDKTNRPEEARKWRAELQQAETATRPSSAPSGLQGQSGP
jgi:hypothetical protein